MPLLVNQKRFRHVRYRGRRRLNQLHDTTRGTNHQSVRPESRESIQHPVPVETLLDQVRLFRQGAAAMLVDPTITPTVLRHLTLEPLIRDALKTETSEVQDETVRACLPLLAGGEASNAALPARSANVGTLPTLQRQKHVAFLRASLGNLPAAFVAADASRPWMLYWALTGLYLLGEDVSEYRER